MGRRPPGRHPQTWLFNDGVVRKTLGEGAKGHRPLPLPQTPIPNPISKKQKEGPKWPSFSFGGPGSMGQASVPTTAFSRRGGPVCPPCFGNRRSFSTRSQALLGHHIISGETHGSHRLCQAELGAHVGSQAGAWEPEKKSSVGCVLRTMSLRRQQAQRPAPPTFHGFGCTEGLWIPAWAPFLGQSFPSFSTRTPINRISLPRGFSRRSRKGMRSFMAWNLRVRGEPVGWGRV